MWETENVLVIDNGSSVCRGGLVRVTPGAVFPSIVGYPHRWLQSHHHSFGFSGVKEFYVGDQAQSSRGNLQLQYPIKGGIIQNWDDMEKIWHHMFYNELCVDPQEHPIIMTEPSLTSKAQRVKMTEIIFDTFHFPALNISNQALLSLFASGRTTGVVVDCGDGVSHCVPIHDGVIQRHGIQRIDVSGRDLTDYLKRLILLEHGTHHFTTTAEHEIVREMKEKLCYVALDFNREEWATASHQVPYELPGGEVIKIGSKLLYRCAEALFHPRFDPIFFDPSQECCGIHQATFNAIMKCDSCIREELFESIVLSGGTTMLPGFADRLRKEITELVPDYWTKIRVIASSNGTNSTWVGGANFGSLSSLDEMCMTREEYYEYGPELCNKKCFGL